VRTDDLPAYREERERLYGEVCASGPPPTTTLVVGGLYHPDCLFEVDAVAVLRD
jgi:enamine deaminase RidA (YjgF/YER057c/UK114 family)